MLNAKHVTDTNSGHEIHKEPPHLVIDPILLEVIEAVRPPRLWRDADIQAGPLPQFPGRFDLCYRTHS